MGCCLEKIEESTQLISQNRRHSSKQSAVGKIYVALYGYDKRSLNELSFNSQDTFEVIECPDNDWWKVKSTSTHHEGYIPASFIVDSTSLLSKPWYFNNCKRREAESALVLSQNTEGSFLIRESETRESEYSLSIRFDDSVKHFRIHKNNDGAIYISSYQTFSSFDSLVAYYKDASIGQHYLLCEPCAKNLIYAPTVPSLTYGTNDQWELDRDKIQLDQQIGSGNFGVVHKGTWDGTVTVAVKTLKIDAMQQEEFLIESQIMKKLGFHKNLVQLLGVCTMEEPMYIVTEFMTHGSLLEYLRETEGIEFHVLMNMAAQVASGMAHIEIKKYIHRDLAARNVLVGENNIVKVADFGLSRLIDEGIYISKSTNIPIKWTAPEACTAKQFTIKSDVWSFGILLFEIFTKGGNPYPGMSNEEVLKQVIDGYRMSRPHGCEEYIYNIMLETWNKTPKERPTFETLQWKLDQHFTLDGSEYVAEEDIEAQVLQY
ncbi:unnamed protein product [Meganyctiphanes norvegica]|uniref:Tyrosine-protein kinase n=1 Tax=Meganyctiphanes norvegica TaxID=48144 RepID=A0AAV2PKD8_MEGNR